jgi:hypothetical protein
MPTKEEVFKRITELRAQIKASTMRTETFLLEQDLIKQYALYGLLCYTWETT